MGPDALDKIAEVVGVMAPFVSVALHNPVTALSRCTPPLSCCLRQTQIASFSHSRAIAARSTNKMGPSAGCRGLSLDLALQSLFFPVPPPNIFVREKDSSQIIMPLFPSGGEASGCLRI